MTTATTIARTYRVAVVLTVHDAEPNDPDGEFRNVGRAIEEAIEMLRRWQAGEAVAPEVDELESFEVPA